MSKTKYRLFALAWFFIFGFLGEYFGSGFLSVIFYIMCGLSFLTLVNSFIGLDK